MYTSIKTVSAVVLSCCLLVTAPFAFAATDLFIRSTDVWHIPEQILAEDSVRIYIKVSNSGDEDATGLVRVIDTLQWGQQVGVDQAISVVAGSSDTVFFDWVATDGDHDFEAQIVEYNGSVTKQLFSKMFVDIDTDGDGIGDRDDLDDDGDNVEDIYDDFPFDPTEWLDTDRDGLGNNTDIDDDGDGYTDQEEIQRGTNPLNYDTDRDGVSDKEDHFPLDDTEVQDTDGDGLGDIKDADDDNDGVDDIVDAFPTDKEEVADTDGDGIGDAKDADDDNDGISDTQEIEKGLDPTNPDMDNDGVLDSEDQFPYNPTESIDTDNDGIGNNADMDDDNDGVADFADPFPNEPSEWKDTDGDGIGDTKDSDDDNDGVADIDDLFPLDNTEWKDTDSDGIGDNQDTQWYNKAPVFVNIPNSVQVEKGELFSLSAVDVYDIDGSIESLQWLYQGRLLSHETELSYSFDSLGVYRIELVAIDNSSEQISQDIYIEVLPASVSKYYWLAVFFIFFSVVVFVIIPGLGKKIARK